MQGSASPETKVPEQHRVQPWPIEAMDMVMPERDG
jgi:hypothetical protein